MALKLKSFARRKMKGGWTKPCEDFRDNETVTFLCQPLPRHQDPMFAALSTVLVWYLSNHQSWGKTWQPVSVLLNNGYILPNILATVSPSPYIKISPKEKTTSSITAEQEDLTGRHGFAWILWTSFISFQNLRVRRVRMC